MNPFANVEKLERKIKTLEEKLWEHEVSETQISELSQLCSLFGTDHEANIGIIVQKACKILAGTCALYTRLGNESKQRHVYIADRPHLEALTKIIQHLDCPITGGKSKDPLVAVEDLNALSEFEGLEQAKTCGLRSCIGLPVKIKKKIIGSLCIFDIAPRKYTANEKRVMYTLAKAAAIEEERWAIENAIQKSEARYRTILEDIEEGYYEVDIKGNFTFVGGAFCDIFGYHQEEIIGKNYTEFITPVTAARAFEIYNTVFSTGRPGKGIFWEIPRKNGINRILESSVSLIKGLNDSPEGFRGIVRDITERRRLEYQLAQAQKMEAIGTLTGGIAHDFNNILSIILGHTEMELNNEGSNKESLREIRTATLRARDVIEQMRTFCRRREPTRRVVGITPIIKESLKLLRASIPKTVQFKMDLDCQHDAVLADPTQIQQILINLCTNAAYAMENNGGIIDVTLTNVAFKASSDSPHPSLQPGEYAALQVSDSGMGIAAEDINRIFDPYFSTKETGKGTGLGLAMVHGIVLAHKGAITVTSAPGKVTTFTVFLPVSEEKPPPLRAKADTDAVGHERILFVDDEASIVSVAKNNLENIGYRVTTATRPDEALAIFKEAPDQFDLVITDMTMPGMTGDKLSAALIDIRADIPVLLCSGNYGAMTEEQAREIGIKGLVTKPYRLGMMAQMIRNVLGRTDSGS